MKNNISSIKKKKIYLKCWKKIFKMKLIILNNNLNKICKLCKIKIKMPIKFKNQKSFWMKCNN